MSVEFDYEVLENQRAHGSCLSELQIRRKIVRAAKDRNTAEALGRPQNRNKREHPDSGVTLKQLRRHVNMQEIKKDCGKEARSSQE